MSEQEMRRAAVLAQVKSRAWTYLQRDISIARRMGTFLKTVDKPYISHLSSVIDSRSYKILFIIT